MGLLNGTLNINVNKKLLYCQLIICLDLFETLLDAMVS